jgi:hypothetical protein
MKLLVVQFPHEFVIKSIKIKNQRFNQFSCFSQALHFLVTWTTPQGDF